MGKISLKWLSHAGFIITSSGGKVMIIDPRRKRDMFESLLDGMEYLVKNIVNRMVVLQSRKGDRQILTGVETLKRKI